MIKILSHAKPQGPGTQGFDRRETGRLNFKGFDHIINTRKLYIGQDNMHQEDGLDDKRYPETPLIPGCLNIWKGNHHAAWQFDHRIFELERRPAFFDRAL